MSRLATRFSSLREQNRCALVPYVVAGDPDPALTVDLLCALVAAGADVLGAGCAVLRPHV